MNFLDNVFSRRHRRSKPATLETILRKLEEMDKAEQDAFDALEAKGDAVVVAITALAEEIATDRQLLKDALAGNDTAGVLAAAAALSAKLDTGIAKAQAALALPVPVPAPEPVPPVATGG